MAKVINITDKLSTAKPIIVINDKEYPVNDGMATFLKFEELANGSTLNSLVQAIEVSLGTAAVEELGVRNWSMDNFKVLTIAILAATQNLAYEEAAARFQKPKTQS